MNDPMSFRDAVNEIQSRDGRFAAEAFAYLGLPEVCKLYCQSDYAMIKAFNPKMKLVRTETIAGGDEYCDHIWALED